MTDSDAVLRRHNHALSLACTQPLSSAFVALLHALLHHAYDTLLGPQLEHLSPPESVADIAHTPGDPLRQNAISFIDSAVSQIRTICVLASYLFPDGNPDLMPPATDAPGVMIVCDDADVIADTQTHTQRPAVITTQVLDEDPAVTIPRSECLAWEAWFQLALATTNRAAYEGHGYVLTALFFSLMLHVRELQTRCMMEAIEAGETEANFNTTVRYIKGEMEAFMRSPMTFHNGEVYWRTVFSAITQTVCARDYARQTTAAETRDHEIAAGIDEVKAKTQKKRAMRASGKRRNAGQPNTAVVNDGEDIAQLVLVPLPLSADTLIAVNDDDNDDIPDQDDDLQGIIEYV